MSHAKLELSKVGQSASLILCVIKTANAVTSFINRNHCFIYQLYKIGEENVFILPIQNLQFEYLFCVTSRGINCHPKY